MPVQQTDIDSHWIWPLVEQGLTVFPLGAVGEYPPHWAIERAGGVEKAKQSWPKQPRGSWKKWQTAKPSDAQITQWIMQHPNCNFAIATGKEIDVVDADDEAAIEWVQQNLTRTPWVVRTGKGAHFYYQVNENLTLKNSADVSAKIDTRGFGGYVVAPGSKHPSGRVYALEIDPQWPVDNVRDLPCLSADDLEKIAGYKRTSLGGAGGNLAGFTAQPLAQVAGVQEGGRNNNLARLVGTWIQQGYSVDQILARAIQTNQGNVPPLPDAEVQTIVHSVIRTHSINHAQEIAETVVEDAEKRRMSSELIGIDEMMEIAKQPLPWLIKPFIYSNSTFCIFGPPKQYKTFVALDMALSMATGLPFLNNWETRQQGVVIYVAGEGQFGVSKRISAWAIDRSIAPEDFTTDKVPFYRTRGSIPINKGGAQAVADQCQAIADAIDKPVLAVVIDTLARNFGDGNENDTKDMNAFIQRCDEDITDRFGCCTIIIHHTSLAEKDRPRGSVVLPGAMDGMIRVMMNTEDQIQVKPLNYKDAESPEPITLETHKIQLPTIDEDGQPEDSIVLKLAPGNASEGANIAANLVRGNSKNLKATCQELQRIARSIVANRPEIDQILIKRGDLGNVLQNVTSSKQRRSEIKKKLLGNVLDYTDDGKEFYYVFNKLYLEVTF